MADFIHPKNEVPEKQATERAISSVSGERPVYRPEMPYGQPAPSTESIPDRRPFWESGPGVAGAAASDGPSARLRASQMSPNLNLASSLARSASGERRVESLGPPAGLAERRAISEARLEARTESRTESRARAAYAPASGMRSAYVPEPVRSAAPPVMPRYEPVAAPAPVQAPVYMAPVAQAPAAPAPVAQTPMYQAPAYQPAPVAAQAPAPAYQPTSAAVVPEAPAAAVAAAPVATAPATPARPTGVAAQGGPASAGATPVKRQIVCFTFYKLRPEWRRLSAEEKEQHKDAFIAVLTKWNKPGEFLSLTYSTIGTRGDVDMCVWSIGYGIDELNLMRSELMGTPLGGYLDVPHNFLAMTKRSQYQIDRVDESEGEGRGAIRPGGQKYIFVYPFWKTRPWFLLSAQERKRLMDEHIRIGLLYPRVKLNTTYSFGIDDQEWVVAFETNFPEDFLDLVQQLRETEISMYTLKDYPIFSCVRLQPREMLNRLG